MKILSCLAILASLSGTAALAQQPASPESVRQQFANPTKNYRPLVRWWWPGNNVDAAELEREIGVLDKAGFGGAEIQPFNIGLPKLPAEAQKRVNDYASPEFFRNVAAAAKAAHARGLFVDYNFGSGWPFGGPHITPELASVELRWSHRSVQGPAQLHTRLELPGLFDGDPQNAAKVTKGLPEGWAERLEKRIKLVAVVAVRGEEAQWFMNQTAGSTHPVKKTGQLDNGSAVNLTARMAPDGTLDWQVPPGTWQIFVFRSVPTVHRLIGGVGSGPQLEMDHWNAAAFAAHAKAVGDAGSPYLQEVYGKGLRAIFCDSLEVREDMFWSDDFLEQFRQRRGYDLTPYLPILKVEGYGGPFNNYDNLPPYDMAKIGNAIRRDYWQTISDLSIERVFAPFNQWAHAHHLLARIQSHGAPADVLKIYGEADIPETENLYDNGRYDFLKEAASAAHVYGRSIVGSESFVWRLNLYQTTPEKMKRASDELLTAGINAILYHGFPYLLPGQPDPGWEPFAGSAGHNSYSSQFNEKNPFWPYLGRFNAYLTRVQYISQAGKSISQVALYHYELQHGAQEPPRPQASPLQQAIMDAGYNYDHFNEESLLRAKVEGGKLISAGGAEYSVLVLPAGPVLSAQLAEKLLAFGKAGLPILFEKELPAADNGFLENAARTARVHAALQTLAKLSTTQKVATPQAAAAALASIAAPDVRFHDEAYPYFERKLGGMTAFFLRNAGDEPRRVTAEFTAEGTPELWNPWTGETARIRTFTRRGKSVEVHFDLPPIGSALLVFTPQPTTTRELPAEQRIVQTLPLDAWKLTATGMTPEGKTATFERSLKELTSWTFDEDLRGLTGNGTYTATFTAPEEKGQSVVLSLGEVGDVAVVKVNGKEAGTLLSRPYTVEITPLLHAGENTLEITVTNALYNSMLLRTPRKFGAGRTFTPSGLLPAGLIGPVQLEVME